MPRRALKHLPMHRWPAADRAGLETAFKPGDIFDEKLGAGAYLSLGTRRMVLNGYSRWLGFVTTGCPADIDLNPAERITPDRVRTYVEQLLNEVRPTSVAAIIHGLHYAARLLDSEADWRWLRSLKARLVARARPADRFERLVPPWQILDHGIDLMDTAFADAKPRGAAIQFRDGLLLSMLSVWPVRRRSIAALTVNDHFVLADGATVVQLYPDDTKTGRFDRLELPELLAPYVRRYLVQLRPLLVKTADSGFWGSAKGGRLTDSRIYEIVRTRIAKRFGRSMGVHDFRRSAATFTATVAPRLVGIIPGALQHTSPKVSEKHYNLARSVEASRRLTSVLSRSRSELRKCGE